MFSPSYTIQPTLPKIFIATIRNPAIMRHSVAAVALTILLTTTTGAVAAQDENQSYDPVFDELADSDDPESFAESRGLSYDNGTVTVVIELEEDAELPDGYSIRVVQTYEDSDEFLAEVRIPVENIRGIAEESTVRYVRVPSTPVKTPTDGPGDGRLNETEDDVREDENDSVEDTDGAPSEDSDGFTFLLAIVAFILVANTRRRYDD